MTEQRNDEDPVPTTDDNGAQGGGDRSPRVGPTSPAPSRRDGETREDPAANQIPAGWSKRPGASIPIASLAPQFGPADHQVYLDILNRALSHPDTRSVAVTGPYGSGKSSVLRGLRKWHLSKQWPLFRRRVITTLSLSTLDPRPASNPDEQDVSNRIQQELVKQLLYRLPTRRTPRSRFPRASSPSWLVTVKAGVVALALYAVGYLVAAQTGWREKVDEQVEAFNLPPALFWIVTAIALSAVVISIWRSTSGRVELKGDVTANALTVSLGTKELSYFDKYLDEIIYFFQVSRTNLLVIEDIDRFSDATVFDTLRALNTLVNSSKQIGRRVVFVYAIRDSVLGTVGANLRDRNEAATELDRSNRAKYFDVVIPVVPFATTNNARDLLLEVMDPTNTGVSPALIRLAARHVADMRTMRSLRNEFEVHAERLLYTKLAQPGINPDIVFALVLLRATSPDEYEKIRLSTSSLDNLNERWRDLVRSNIEQQTVVLTNLLSLSQSVDAETAAKGAGELLEALRPRLLSMGAAISANRVTFRDPLAESGLDDLAGWRAIASGTPLTVEVARANAGYSQALHLELDCTTLELLLGIEIRPELFVEADSRALDAQIVNTKALLWYLRHHSWEDIYTRTDIAVETKPGSAEIGRVDGRITFADLVAHYSPSPLLAALVKHGYLPAEFASYSSMFYGRVIGVAATEYLRRVVGPGKPAPDYPLAPRAILDVLLDQQADEDDSAEFFDDLSIYNLDIVDHLIQHRPGPASRVAEHLAKRWGEEERKFTDLFLPTSGNAVKLVGLMAQHWPGVVRYTTVEVNVTPDRRLHLVDAVLNRIPNADFIDLTSAVGQYLSENYALLNAVVSPSDKSRAQIVMEVIRGSGASVADLSVLDDIARDAAVAISVYPVTRTNLETLGGLEDIALDALRNSIHAAYQHSLVNIIDYLNSILQMGQAGVVLRNPDQFATVLTEVAYLHNERICELFVQSTTGACRISDLGTVPVSTWRSLIKMARTEVTFSNVQHYIIEYGVDEELGVLLTDSPAIDLQAEIAVADRKRLALTILSSREAIARVQDRVRLAISLRPGAVQANELDRVDGNLVAPLLTARLLVDDDNAFDPELLSDWVNFEAAVAASEFFAEFAETRLLPSEYLAPLLDSEQIVESTRQALIGKLDTLVGVATADQATAVARVLTRRASILDFSRIEALRAVRASDSSLVGLIAAQEGHLDDDALRALLCNMGGEYAKIGTGRGESRKASFAANADHDAILRRLEGITHTGVRSQGGVFSVNLKDA